MDTNETTTPVVVPTTSTLPPPPPVSTGANIPADHIAKLYNSNFEQANEIARLKLKYSELESTYATERDAVKGKVDSFDKLQAQYTELEANHNQYKEYALGHLTKEFEGIDELLKADINFDDLKDTPLKSLQFITNKTAQFNALAERYKNKQSSGEGDGLNGDPNKSVSTEEIVKFNKPSDTLAYLKKHEND